MFILLSEENQGFTQTGHGKNFFKVWHGFSSKGFSKKKLDRFSMVWIDWMTEKCFHLNL